MVNASAILFRSDGKMLVATYSPSKINLVDTDGTYSLLYSGSGLNGPIGLRYTSQGKLIIGNFNDGKIFSVDTSSGVFSLIADLPGSLGFIEIVNDEIYSTGFQTNKIYKTSLNGDTMTVAGTGAAGQLNGPALSSTFSSPNGIVRSVTGDTLYVSDYAARSLRMLTGITIGIINVSTIAPEKYSLKQNYPNPFNPVTNIKFEVAKSGLVTLKVFDISGREAALLVNEEMNAGTYNFDFNAAHLSSGIYFYQLTAANYTDTKKMILIK